VVQYSTSIKKSQDQRLPLRPKISFGYWNNFAQIAVSKKKPMGSVAAIKSKALHAKTPSRKGVAKKNFAGSLQLRAFA